MKSLKSVSIVSILYATLSLALLPSSAFAGYEISCTQGSTSVELSESSQIQGKYTALIHTEEGGDTIHDRLDCKLVIGSLEVYPPLLVVDSAECSKNEIPVDGMAYLLKIKPVTWRHSSISDEASFVSMAQGPVTKLRDFGDKFICSVKYAQATQREDSIAVTRARNKAIYDADMGSDLGSEPTLEPTASAAR